MKAIPAFLLVFLLVSCAGASKRFVYNQDRQYVALKAIKIKKDAPPYRHPYYITSQEMHRILDRIFYRHMVVIRYVWSKPRFAFTREQRALLAPLLAEALSEARPDEEIVFSVIEKEHKRRRTSGTIFVDEEGLNIVLTCLMEPDFTVEATEYDIDQVRWKLWPVGDGQKYQYNRPDDKQKQYNWLIISMPEMS